jgi:hypothetical protein
MGDAANINKPTIESLSAMIARHPAVSATAQEPAFGPLVRRALDVAQQRSDARVAEKASRLPPNPTADDVLRTVIGTPAKPGSSLRRERFQWPVKTEYGSVVDMPITVNPTRRDILSALADAPHGDVRALKTPAGDVYMWPANEALHRDIAMSFDLPFKTRQDLQRASYLVRRKDVEHLPFKSFDELIGLLGQ